ncbi:MAG TPA: hypothetical protein VHD36_15530 [Pirellulales bacterium]|nr:hypothetical protein [Pirellulales bacterium]
MSRMLRLPHGWPFVFGPMLAVAQFLIGESYHCAAADTPVAATVIDVTTPMPPPEWALLERELLRAASAGCEQYFERYFDDRGYLECVERWGGDDGPDDAIECLADWPLLYALGGSPRVFELYKKGWEGHLRQYTAAKTVDVEMARDGMYYKEFPVSLDWLHHAEGLTAFINSALADPNDPAFQRRIRRFAGLYLGEEPGVVNYDRQHKIIRSLFNGSRGPLLRKATGLDWAGDPIEVEGRFAPAHGERSYAEMVAHFKDYNDIVGDHPQNLCATSLATVAFMLDHEPKYRDWVLEYVDAWVDRMRSNNGIIPTNIGLDGSIGGECGGRWYGGVYGWGFTVITPQTGAPANRNTHALGLSGFGNATLLTGNTKYADAWRAQISAVNAQSKSENGQTVYPQMYGDQGWYAYSPSKYSHGVNETAYWSMKPDDAGPLPDGGWQAFLAGRQPAYPAAALRADLETLRAHMASVNNDKTTPDTRLADDPLPFSPAVTTALVNLTLGGLYPGHQATPLHARVRYFDPVGRRPGLPDGVSALVEKLSADGATLTLVNVDAVSPHSVIVQGGAYGEHQITGVSIDGKQRSVGGRSFVVHLAPGCGTQLALDVQRYANPPSLVQPWDDDL